MYKGIKKFDYDQVMFVVNVMMTAAVDQVESNLPTSETDCFTMFGTLSKAKKEIHNLISCTMGDLGWNLSIFYAQLTNDGMGTGDAAGASGLLPHLHCLLEERIKNNWKHKGKKFHNIPIESLVEKFIEDYFGEYLELTPKEQLWIRVGDAGEYESFGDDFDALTDTLYEASVVADDIVWIEKGLQTSNYPGQDYISLFWGDGRSEPIRDLTFEERRMVVSNLRNLEKERKRRKQRA